ncbi:MAG: copper homeostasis protein CutC [Planctomycetes bacterium]|nr:copper homeostasis protein CutC [Planctomycetota bacterium]
MSNIESRVLFEVPVETLAEAVAAARGGADRLELCASLDVGGITPSFESIQQFAFESPLPFVVMVRPRAGDFVYKESERRDMAVRVAEAHAIGMMGVVFGALTGDRRVNIPACESFMAISGPMATVFHRAFDQITDPFAALDDLITLGVTRVLTSGGGDCAADPACARRIAQLIDHANGRIEILPGGGIRAHNVKALLDATNATSIHSSCRRDSRLDPAMVAELRRVIDDWSASTG